MAARPDEGSTGPMDEAMAGARVRVLLPLPLRGPYDYAAPDGMDLAPGRFVVAPLGNRTLPGVVWDAGDEDDADRVPDDKLKPVRGVLDAPPMAQPMRRLVEWVAGYTLTPPGAVLRMAMSVPAALEPPRPRTAYRALPPEARPEVRLTAARRRVLAALGDGPPRLPGELAREAGVSGSVVKGLADAGLLEAVAEVAGPAFRPPDWERPGPDLTADQTAVAEVLRRTAAAGSFHVTLLDGVTGSGKTEVYLEAVAAALAAGRQALVLLPEIALSTQWLERFARRFGVRPAEWHSDLSQTERRVTWRAVARGDARVVVGARSALFLPFPALGLTVIDEEHDAAYKQEDGVVYHARDMAVVRARLEGRPIVLVSATPSLESLVNVADGRYAHLHLPERFSTARLPAVELVDLRQEKPPRVLARGPAWLSMPLRSAVAEALAAQEQAMLFLNRRGYAPLTLCDACGHRLKCPDCTAWLVEHRLGGRLTCHHCGYTTRLPAECPVCGAEHPFRACGPGVERIAEEAAALFPEARIAIVSSDTVASPLAAAEMVSAIEEHRVDLLVGTQILAKGHHFPLLTVVGVVDGDLGLFGGDLRAAERTFQMLQQVAGRAGRAERAGRVLVQTHEPGHPVMQALAANDRERFVAVELAHRRRDRLPPFARYAAVVISAPDAARADEAARLLARAAPRQDQVQVLGPAPAVLAVLRGRHRRRFLVKAPRTVVLQPLLRYWLGSVKVPSAVRIQVDVDPYSFL